MAISSTSRYFSATLLLIFYLRILNADPERNKSFSFKNFGKDSNFASELALYGDAKVVNGGAGAGAGAVSSIQVSSSMTNSAGRVMFKKPFKLLDGKPRKMVSFSMEVVFSMSSESGDGLVFMVVPVGFPLDVFDDGGGSFGLLGERKDRFLGVEFDTFKDEKYGDVNDNHVGIDVGSFVSVKSSNVSVINVVLKSGEKLQAWIDYEASSRRLEVRLCKLGENKPVDPLLSCPIDLSQMWKESQVLVGLSASSGNSTQKCNVYSWSFKLSTTPHWMHSEPLDPKAHVEKKKELNNNNNSSNLQKRSDCALKVLAALIFGTGCGALGALIVLFLWTILGNRRPVVPEDYAMPSKDHQVEYKLQKIVVVDKTIEDGKN